MQLPCRTPAHRAANAVSDDVSEIFTPDTTVNAGGFATNKSRQTPGIDRFSSSMAGSRPKGFGICPLVEGGKTPRAVLWEHGSPSQSKKSSYSANHPPLRALVLRGMRSNPHKPTNLYLGEHNMDSSHHDLRPDPPAFYGRDGRRETPETPERTYRPSPEEIEESCRRIRQNWSEAEHRRRAGVGVQRLQLAVVPCRLSLPSGWDLDP
jgi:hypothetical protein